MKRLLFIAAIALALTACDKKEPEATGTTTETTAPATAAQAEDTEEPAQGEEGAAADGMLEVAAAGTKFDPPVEPAKLPDGVWYCDMGTVHYARAEKGDGKCEICGMQLKEKGDAAAAKEGDGHDHDHGEEGHDHGEGEHDHAH